MFNYNLTEKLYFPDLNSLFSSAPGRRTVAVVFAGISTADLESGGMGLGIMRERAADIGADLSIETQAAGGTAVVLTWIGEIGDSS